MITRNYIEIYNRDPLQVLHSHQIFSNYYHIFFHSVVELGTDSVFWTRPHKSLQHLVQCCRQGRCSNKSHLMIMTYGPWRLVMWATSCKASLGLSVLHPPDSGFIWIEVISQKYYQIREQGEWPFENVRYKTCALFGR